MFFDRYGENTVKSHRLLLMILIAAVVSVAIAACGQRVDKNDATAKKVLTEEEQITQMLNDAMYRLSYGDKSGLYDLEFEYQRYETDFDKYLGIGVIGWANADGWDSIQVDSIEFFRPDSAWVFTHVYFSERPPPDNMYEEKLVIYQDDGRWIKPTVSKYLKQQEYLEIFRQADSAANAESEG